MQWALIGVLLLGLAGLLTFRVPQDARRIQDDIRAQTMLTLKDHDILIPPEWVAVEGRDITLTGIRNTSFVSDSTRDLVRSVRGVRDPVRLKILDPPPPPQPPPLSAEAQKVEAELNRFLVGKTIRFEIASPNIHPEGRIVLDQVFRIVAPAPTVSVDITGYMDNDGDLSFSLDLSKRRAAAVRQFLIAKGIRADRLTSEGFGSGKPIAPNDTPENRAKNRRIEFHASSRIPGAPLANQ